VKTGGKRLKNTIRASSQKGLRKLGRRGGVDRWHAAKGKGGEGLGARRRGCWKGRAFSGRSERGNVAVLADKR